MEIPALHQPTRTTSPVALYPTYKCNGFAADRLLRNYKGNEFLQSGYCESHPSADRSYQSDWKKRVVRSLGHCVWMVSGGLVKMLGYYGTIAGFAPIALPNLRSIRSVDRWVSLSPFSHTINARSYNADVSAYP